MLSLELTGRRTRLALPLIALGLSFYVPARNSIWLGNLDGFVLAGEAAFLLDAARGRWTLAALLMGATLAVKPALAPLLIVFLLRRRPLQLGLAVGVPLVLSFCDLPVGTDSLSLLTQVSPYILQGQSSSSQNANVSLSGAAAALGLPPSLAPAQ